MLPYQKEIWAWMRRYGCHVTMRSMENHPEVHDKFKRYAWHLDLEQQQCFRNAFRTVDLLDDVYYVEGWTIASGRPIEHAWIAYDGPEGLIHFDPTFELVLSLDLERSYFAIIVLDDDEVNQFARETGMYGGWMRHEARKRLACPPNQRRPPGPGRQPDHGAPAGHPVQSEPRIMWKRS